MYIAIEWTSAAFHAWHLRANGAVIAEHKSAAGVNTVTQGAFDSALRAEIASWLTGAQAILLSGMVTSRTGWVESPFTMVPAAVSDLLGQAVRREIAGLPPLYFLPGIARLDPVPDVMRGEEIAIFGIDGKLPECIVLPGAHTKWVRTDGTRITDLSTYLSGEILNLLRKDSLVSRLIPASHETHAAAFERGVLMAKDKRALPGGVLQRIFSARSLVLFDRLKPEEIADYLAGVVVGSEIVEALTGVDRPKDVRVLGNTALAESYRRALRICGVSSPIGSSDPVLGFAKLVSALRVGRFHTSSDH